MAIVDVMMVVVLTMDSQRKRQTSWLETLDWGNVCLEHDGLPEDVLANN